MSMGPKEGRTDLYTCKSNEKDILNSRNDQVEKNVKSTADSRQVSRTQQKQRDTEQSGGDRGTRNVGRPRARGAQ